MSKSAVIKIEEWKDIVLLSEQLDSSFIFRGQSNSEWTLSSSLERTMDKFCDPILKNLFFGNKEHWMLHEFKRKYQLYSNHSPNWEDKFEWLAIMQHHGAPTRLLDFTESIYIASYFAVVESNIDCAIFCINNSKLKDRVKEKYGFELPKNSLKDDWNSKFIEIANEHIYNSKEEKSKDLVLSLEPKRATKRLSFQQGLFLMPLNSEKSFMENLSATIDETIDPDYLELKTAELKNAYSNYNLVKIIIPAEITTAICRELLKMNITAETLFPGLDGLAKSFIQQKIRDGI